MKKMLSLLLFISFISFILPFGNANAMTSNGRYELSDFTYIPTNGFYAPEKIFDGDLSTSGSINWSTTVYLSFKTPSEVKSIFTSSDRLGMGIYDENGKFIYGYDAPLSYGELADHSSKLGDILKGKKISKISFNNRSGNSSPIKEIQIYAPMEVVHADISDLSIKEDQEEGKILLNWSNPQNISDIKQIKIYRDGDLIKSLGSTQQSFTDENIKLGNSYNYKISVLFSDNYETEGITKKITTTAEEPIYLRDIESNPSYNQIDFNWKNPEKAIQEIRVLRDGKLIGQTTGTSFIDKNVIPLKTYSYIFQVVSKFGTVTDSKEIKVTTLKEPKPVLEGGNFQKEENGDYTVTWEQPTTGIIRIIVGGKVYKEVSADTGKYTIPSKDMAYNPLGEPDVRLQPISQNGTEGDSIQSPGLPAEVPFTVHDLIGTGNGLLWLVAPFILLALSFLLVPKLRNLITGAFRRNRNSEKGSETRRYKRSDKDLKNNPEKAAREKQIKERQEKEQQKGRDYLEKANKQDKRTTEKPGRITKEPKPPRIRQTSKIRTQRIAREPRETRAVSRQSREPREPREPRKRRSN